MASPTYKIYRAGVTWSASSVNYLGLFNGSGSGKTVKVTRAWAQNIQTSGITGGLTIVELWRITAFSGYTLVSTIVPYDANNAAAPAQILFGHSGTATNDTNQIEPFVRVVLTTEEAKLSTGTIGEINANPALTCLWDAGYGDSDVEPITLPEGYGFCIKSGASGNTNGSGDFYIEYVLE